MRLAQRHLDDGTVDVGGLLDQGVAELATAVAELRQIAHGLRPTSLDDGLHAALIAITQSRPVGLHSIPKWSPGCSVASGRTTGSRRWRRGSVRCSR